MDYSKLDDGVLIRLIAAENADSLGELYDRSAQGTHPQRRLPAARRSRGDPAVGLFSRLYTPPDRRNAGPTAGNSDDTHPPVDDQTTQTLIR